ncbi:MAG: XRE family transcriptional regulator [Candidatus Melainabacteria bacterium]|nr:XRE family transcriptional regulator [Candidatus Melainabacteria bacterium]
MARENKNDDSIRHGSGNVFADLGFSEPDTHLLKAQLVNRIDEIVTERNLTQVQAAQAMGISQPDVSRLLKGQFREISLERIMRLLTRLGCDVDIVIKLPGRKRANSIIHLKAAGS